MADLVPSTDVKENERALQQEQAHEVEQPQRAQSHDAPGSPDANAGTAALLMNGANGMNYVDGSRWLEPDGGGRKRSARGVRALAVVSAGTPTGRAARDRSGATTTWPSKR